MKKYLHRILGLYETLGAAEIARERLVLRGLLPEQLTVLQSGPDGVHREARPEVADLIPAMLRAGTLGAMAGLFAAGVVILMLALVRSSLFNAVPVLGALTVIAWGVTLGGIIGVGMGMRSRKGDVTDLLGDLLTASPSGGQIVLVAHAATEEQTTTAQLVLGESKPNPARA